MCAARYIEVFEANPLDVASARDRMGGGGRGFGRGSRMKGSFAVQLRGLPYRASEDDIADWCAASANPTDVFIIMEGWDSPPSHSSLVTFSISEAGQVGRLTCISRQRGKPREW